MADTAQQLEDERFPGGRRAWWLCIALLVLLAATRSSAAWYSFALDGYSDEPAVVDPALAAARGVLRPAEFLYPGWTAYSLGALYKLLDLLGYGGTAGFTPEVATPEHFVVGRLFVMAISLATLVATALLARRLVGAWAGIAAACWLACSPMFTGMSFLVTVNPPASLWTTLSILFAARVYVAGRKLGDYVLAGVCAGLAVGCKYNSYPAAAALLVAHAFAPSVAGLRHHTRALFGLALVPIVFFATTPFALFEFSRFMTSVSFLDEVYKQDWPLHTDASGSSWLAYIERMWRFGWPRELTIAAVMGAAWLTVRDARRTALLSIAALANFVFLGFYAVFFLRHLLPALPALAVLSACVVQAAVEWVGRGRAFAERGRSLASIGVAVLVIAACGTRALLDAQTKIAKVDMPDSRQAALEWVLANIPKGARIVREERTPQIEAASADYEVLALRCIAVPDRTREVEGYDYAILSRNRALQRDPNYAEAKLVYAEFMARHELVVRFDGNGVEYSGRDMLIYKIDKQAAAARPPADASPTRDAPNDDAERAQPPRGKRKRAESGGDSTREGDTERR